MIPLIAAFVLATAGLSWVDTALQDVPLWVQAATLVTLMFAAIVCAAIGILGGKPPRWWEDES